MNALHALSVLLTLVVVTGCQAPRSRPLDVVSDMGPPATDCQQRLASDTMTLWSCRGDTRLRLTNAQGLTISEWTPQLTVDEISYRLESWSIAAWSSQGDSAVLTLFDSNVPVRAVLTITFVAPSQVELGLTVTAQTESRLSETHLLEGHLETVTQGMPKSPTCLVTGADKIGLSPTTTSTPRRHESGLQCGPNALWIGALSGQDLTISISEETSGGPWIRVGNQTSPTLREGQTVRQAVRLTFGQELTDVMVRHAGLHRDDPTLEATLVGWRSGPSLGLIVRSDVTQDVTDWWQQRDIGRVPTIAQDGLWYTDLGAWQIAPWLMDLATPVEHTLFRWPVTHLSRAAFEAQGRPRGVEVANCDDADCVQVNLSSPAGREYISRAAIELRDQGIARVHLANLGPMDGSSLVDLVDALQVGTFDHISVPFHPMATGLDVTLVLGPDEVSGSEPCPHIFALERSACVMALSPPLNPPSPVSTSPPPLRTLAWRLALHWHWAQYLKVDLGPVWTTYPDEAALRQAATIAAISGGMYLLGGDLNALSPLQAAILFAPIQQDAIQAARPNAIDGERVPLIWESNQTLALFNWGEEEQVLQPPARWQSTIQPTTDVFTGQEIQLGPRVTVPPHDVLFLLR